jgi:small subunit ribosomal protein S12e
MSDAEVQSNAGSAVEQVEPVAESGPMKVEEALEQVLKTALVHDGVARGLRETAKQIDKGAAHLVVLVETCTEAAYIKLIEALAATHDVPLVRVSDAKVLGQWVGLAKIDREGNPRKIVGCSSVAVTNFGAETPALSVLLEHFKSS